MTGTTEAFSRVRIDALLGDAGWNPADGAGVLFKHTLPDGTRADYVLRDRQGRPMAVIEAKRASVNPVEAQDQGRHYAERLDVVSAVPIDRKIVDRDYQIDCIEALSAEVSRGRRKLLVEMATGTGKTRVAAAFVKRLFEAGVVTRVLFLVDRIALAGQAEDAFTDHLRDYPCHVLRPGRGFDYAKRITIATL